MWELLLTKGLIGIIVGANTNCMKAQKILFSHIYRKHQADYVLIHIPNTFL
jgi:hypothetical protein